MVNVHPGYKKKKPQFDNHHYLFTELRNVYDKSRKELFLEWWDGGGCKLWQQKWNFKLTLHCYDLYFKKSSVFG